MKVKPKPLGLRLEVEKDSLASKASTSGPRLESRR